MKNLRRLGTALLLCAAMAAAGCRERMNVIKGTPSDARSTTAYTVRGEIVQLPAGAGRDLVIRHEAIPDFRDQSGTKVGMDSMMMPFALESGVKVAGLAVGDKVKFQLDVDWQQPRFSVAQIEKLPAGTVLKLGPADAHMSDILM